MKELKNIENLSVEEIVEILENPDNSAALAELATRVKMSNFGNSLKVTALLEFSNHCEETCYFCYYRDENFSLNRFRMTPEEIISTVLDVSNKGIKDFIIESGEDSFYDTDIISYIVYTLKQTSDISITLSLGKRGFDEYKNWKYAGAEKYILPLDQTGKSLIDSKDESKNFEQRIRHLQYLKRLGYQTGCSIIVGLPEQSLADLANDIILIGKLKVNTLLINPFIPYPFTPYQNQKAGNVDFALKILSLCRILFPNSTIPASPFLHFGTEIQTKAVEAGANSVYPYITPQPYFNKLKIAYPKDFRIGLDPIKYSYGLNSDGN